ncbi:helix-turn-helix transcriptional regulator [Actinacidiphila glaucinigra]|uniref:helix-turn-helix transcriptional regulator n=1 Tax=Actinacidiphila glaucinigra TaxID=235986 RepID=UPI00366B28D0
MTIPPPDPDFDALRLELARLRADRGWTYDQLAERTGVSRRTLIDIEQGRTIGTLNTWHALVHALGVSFDRLLGSMCTDHHIPGPHTV